MKINNTGNVFTQNIKYMAGSRKKRDLKLEKTDTIDLNGPDSEVILSKEALLPGAVNQEVTSGSDESSTKKDAGFKIDNGILQGTFVTGNNRGGFSSPSTLTIIEEPYFTTLKPEITEKFVSSLLLDVPDTRQSTEYSCGASALQAVLMYWGDEYSEKDLMDMLHTTEYGTHPEDIVRVGKELGYEAELKENLTLEDLEKSIKEGVPVIVTGQAWREGEDLNKPWKDVWESGHYMVVIGMDDNTVYIEDPSLLGSQGTMPRQEFLDRWHDYEGDIPFDDKDRKYIQAGIFIKGKAPKPRPEFVHIRMIHQTG